MALLAESTLLLENRVYCPDNAKYIIADNPGQLSRPAEASTRLLYLCGTLLQS
jgi:hypothetical protein